MTKNSFIKQLRSEDWVIVFAGLAILLLASLFPQAMPIMPKHLTSVDSVMNAVYMFLFLTGLTFITSISLKRSVKCIVASMLVIFIVALVAQLVANIPICKKYGLEPVFFSVIFGLAINNLFGVPDWLKRGIQSEFYIKIGIIALGSTIIFSEVLKAGMFGFAQSLIVVVIVWYFAFWISRKVFKVDDEMSTMLASAVSICGVSAAIATCGAIKGDNKKLSYVISLVLVTAIPMMYIMPWLSNLMGLSQAVGGAWMGGTIDTTGAVAASGTLLGEEAAQIAIIVKSSQNVLLGIAAFAISLMWSLKGSNGAERPTLATIWERFPKFVVGFIAASLIFSICFPIEEAKAIGKITKGFSTTLFSIAFVCIGLETNFKDLFNQENRAPLKAFMSAQLFNVIVTLIVSYLIFGFLL